VEVVGHHTEVSPTTAGMVVAVPVALVLVLVWVLHRPLVETSEVPAIAVFPAAALMIGAALAAPTIGVTGVLVAVAVLTVAVVIVTIGTKRVAPSG
jgi:hypothetical protein